MAALTIGRKIPQQALRDVLKVGRALTQKWIGDPPHRFEEILHHRVERVLGILLTAGDRRQDPLDQRAVLKHHHMGLENSAFVVTRKVLKPTLQLDELTLGGLQCLVEARLFVRHLGLGDFIHLRRRKPAGDDMQGSNRDARGCRNPLVNGLDFLVRVIHRVKPNCFPAAPRSRRKLRDPITREG